MEYQVKTNLINVLNKLIAAHRAMQSNSDFHTESLIGLIKDIESEVFFQKDEKDQILFLAGVRGKYTGKGEVLWSLIPQYLDESFFSEFREAFSSAIQSIKD